MSISPSADRPTPTASPGPNDRMPQVDIGIDAEDRKNIAQGLSEFLSDAFTLYLKTHNFHWNVTGAGAGASRCCAATSFNPAEGNRAPHRGPAAATC